MPKKSKKCSRNKARALLWYSYTTTNLGVKLIMAIALTSVALGIHPIKNQAQFFNRCITQVENDKNNISSAVRFCNGGD